MATQGWTDEALDAYYEPVIGAEIAKVHHSADCVWLHLSDGSMIEIVAEAVGFCINLHPHTPHRQES